MAITLGFFGNGVSAQQYEVGDIVENFTLVNRANNQEVSLYDMEGKIIFLEWFAYWCPFCQAAAADIGPGIVEYYEELGGNPSEIEVMHVGMNLQGGAETQTQNFVTRYGLTLVLNDFNRAVASRFQPSNQPIFAIINGVANSSTHQQWELLYTELGYQNLNTPIQTFRTAINSVEATNGEAPSITIQPMSQTVETGMSLELSVSATSESPAIYQWQFNGADIPGATEAVFSIPSVLLDDAGLYSVKVTNSSGETISEAADISVLIGFLDTLIAQGVPESMRGMEDDPDGDNVINALEFLARTDANDADSKYPPLVSTITMEGDSYLVFSYVVDQKSVPSFPKPSSA